MAKIAESELQRARAKLSQQDMVVLLDALALDGSLEVVDDPDPELDEDGIPVPVAAADYVQVEVETEPEEDE
jgi:hypothetical protein